ncbi:MAG: NUDIX hydrolase [Candidatus Paceibacterota bacterium]|jgi:8-oxo-dGTP pyrophosphatase MutT (NUDIX family)
MNIERPISNQPMPSHAKKVFDGQIFDVYQWEQELYDGTTAIYEKLKRADTAIVFGVLSDGRILLTEQEQPGKIPFRGAAGGRVDPGEDVLHAAKRELLEETGYEAERFILWDAQHPTSKIDWVVFTFIAKGLKEVGGQNLDPGEKIKLMPVTFDELVDIVTTGDFAEKEIKPMFLQAKYNSEKMEELRKLFDPKS